MIRAAVIPYLRRPVDPATGIGTCCLVRIHDGGRALAEEAIPVGYLDTSGQRPVRVVGEGEIAAVVARVVAIAIKHGAELAHIEEPSGAGVEADRARAIARALTDAFSDPRVYRCGSVTLPAAKGDLAERLSALLKDEGPGGVTVEPLPVQPEPVKAEATLRHEPTPAPPAAQVPKHARRIAGIDPGSKHVAVVVMEEVGATDRADRHTTERSPAAHGVRQADLGVQQQGDPTLGVTPAQARMHHIASLPLTIGRAVPLRTPKTITRKDGSTYTKTERHEVTDADRLSALRAIAAFCALHEIDEAVVETATHAHGNVGAFVLRSNRLGGMIEAWLLAAGLDRETGETLLPVRAVSSTTHRSAARRAAGAGSFPSSLYPDKRERKAARKAANEWAVRTLIAGIPDLSPADREHIIDAGSAGLWTLAPPPEVKPAPTRTRAPRGSGKAGTWTAADADRQRARREARRRAAGCVCVGRCRAPCPVAVAANEKRAQKMMGNVNARRSEA